MKKKIIATLLMLPILIVIIIDLMFGLVILESHIRNTFLILTPYLMLVLASLMMWRKGAKAYAENKARGITLMLPGWIIIGLPSISLMFYILQTPFLTICEGKGVSGMALVFGIALASLFLLLIVVVIISVIVGVMLMFHSGLRKYAYAVIPLEEPHV